MHEVYFTIIKDIKLQFKNSAKRLLFVEKKKKCSHTRQDETCLHSYVSSVNKAFHHCGKLL